MISSVLLAASISALPVLDITKYGASTRSGDDSYGVQKALDKARSLGGAIVYVPKGTFEVSGLRIYSNTQLVGDGAGLSVLKSKAANENWMLSVNPYYAGFADPARNERNILISKLTFRDRSDTDGFSQHDHALNINGASFLTVQDCEILGYRGDGIYLGSGNITDQERHNEDIKILRVKFDGLNYQNRNAITIIDATRLTIDACTVVRSTRTDMPAQFDMEPNKYTFHRLRDVVISNNTFTNNNGKAAIVLDVPFAQSQLLTPIGNIAIRNNRVTSTRTYGVMLYQVDSPTGSTTPTNVEISGNHFRNMGSPIGIEGISAVRIQNNRSWDTGTGYAIGYGPLGRGVYNVSITDNRIERAGRQPTNCQGSAIAVMNAAKVDILRNTAVDIFRPDGLPGCLTMLRGGQGGGASRNVTVAYNTMAWTATTVSAPTWLKILDGHTADLATTTVEGNALGIDAGTP